MIDLDRVDEELREELRDRLREWSLGSYGELSRDILTVDAEGEYDLTLRYDNHDVIKVSRSGTPGNGKETLEEAHQLLSPGGSESGSGFEVDLEPGEEYAVFLEEGWVKIGNRKELASGDTRRLDRTDIDGQGLIAYFLSRENSELLDIIPAQSPATYQVAMGSYEFEAGNIGL